MIAIANPWHHAVSSSRKWGGDADEYLPVHAWFDATKAHLPDFRHRALRHHAEGIFLCEAIFGATLTLRNGKVIPVRWIGEQHVREDLGRIPTAADWLRCISPQPWMSRSRPLSRELEERPGTPDSASQQTPQPLRLAAPSDQAPERTIR